LSPPQASAEVTIMESTLLPFLLAAAVAMLVWGVAVVVRGLTDAEKRKLQQRLVAENENGAVNLQLPLSITRTTAAASGTASALISRWSRLQALHRTVVQAYPNGSVARFLSVVAGSAVLLFLVMAGLTENLVIGAVGGAVGGYIPFLMLSQKHVRRQRMIAAQLPEAMDFLARVLQAGHSFSTGVQMLSEELPVPLKDEFRRCYEQHSLGQPLEDSLKEMATHIESTDFAFFVTAVLIQRQTGGDLSEVLKNISAMIRQRIRLQQHVKAKTAEGRFTGYVLVAFPAAMFLLVSVMNQDYAHKLTATPIGHKLLATALCLQMSGLYAIRKLTTVKV
jgi:tight adherence protein B